MITFQMNQNSNPALKDVRVRQAIVYAINNEGIVDKVMKGQLPRLRSKAQSVMPVTMRT